MGVSSIKESNPGERSLVPSQDLSVNSALFATSVSLFLFEESEFAQRA